MNLLLALLFAVFQQQEYPDLETMKRSVEDMRALELSLPNRLEKDLIALEKRIHQLENIPNSILLKSLQVEFTRIQYGFSLILEMQHQNDALRRTYFKLWGDFDQLKERVDRLYVSKNIIGSQALMISDEVQKFRKKHIYTAYTTIYEQYGLRLKVVSDCDFEMKVEILEKLIKLLKVCEALLEVNTKELEKQLKSTDEINEKFRLLMTYDYLLTD